MCWIFKVNTGYRHQCLKNYGMTYAICNLSILGPFIQSIVSLTSSLLVKMLTVLVRYFANAKATHIFSAKILAYMPYLLIKLAGLGGSVGCAVRLETRRSRVQPPPRSATFFRGDWSWNIFYGHSLPSADSRRAVVSFWRKNVHNTG